MLLLAWTDQRPDVADGPWLELRPLAEGLFLVDTDAGRSAVYHALKRSLPAGSALLVTALDEVPKAKGLAPGWLAWARRRLGGAGDEG